MSRPAIAGRVQQLAGAWLLLAAAFALPARARGLEPPKPGALPPVKVQDLYYGDVLFYFYQDDYFNALTRLSAAELRGRVAHHAADAELLLGGLYLSVGQHREAGQIFSAVLNRPGVPAAVRSRARFFLGKVWYQRGYLEQAAATLAAAAEPGLNPAMEAERRMLLAQALLYQARYPQAIAVLEHWQAPPPWKTYADFNLGIALVRSGRVEEGGRLLDAIGQLPAGNREIDALRDKANLALGFALLQAQRPLEARPVLERVRLEGPLSNKALLGVGWADSAAGDQRAALVPWLELRGRNLLDAAVQESYLAVPYAYAKLGANKQAADYYESAVHEFLTESARLDESIAAIRGGGLIETIVNHEAKGQMGWFWQLQQLPDAPESRYLYHLLAGNEFQEGLKNYRMMRYMGRNLDAWALSVEAFDDMLATRRQRYAERMPQVLDKLQAVDLGQLQHRRTDYESRVVGAEKSGDLAALGTPREREIWTQVVAMETLLGTASEDDDDTLADTRDRLRLVKGVIYWQLNEGFKARAWAARRNLKDAAQALRETEKRWSLVQEAKTAVPARNAEYAVKIAALRPRIEAARSQLAALERKQGDYLADIAIHELEAQKDRITTYTLQARYALATIYDRASAPPETRPGPRPADEAPR